MPYPSAREAIAESMYLDHMKKPCTYFDFNFLGLLWACKVVLLEVEGGHCSVHGVPDDVKIHGLWGTHPT